MKKINLLYSVGLAALLIFPSCEDSWTGEEVVITELTIVNTTADNCYSDSVSVQFAAIDQDGDTTTNVWWISSNETVTVSSTGLATLSGNICTRYGQSSC